MTLLDAQPVPDGDLSAHRYNDDMLVAEVSRQFAAHEFPSLFHVLDDERLRLTFLEVERDAKAAKVQSQRAGIFAVIAAVLSLAAASTEPVWHTLHEPWPIVTAIASAVLGVIAVVVAALGVLYGKRKDLWLRSRVRTERLRQFHFQALIWTLPEIARSCADDSAGKAYVKERSQKVDGFANGLAGRVDSELGALLRPDGGERIWLYDAADGVPKLPEGFDARPLFRAYRRLRFEEQISYATHKLTRSNASLAFAKVPLRNQQQILRFIWLFSLSSLALLHVVLLGGYLGTWGHFDIPRAHVVVILLALIALGGRTLEEGLGLAHEIERYEDYIAEASDALRHFDAATDDAGRLHAMIEMERASFNEMRSFLRMMNRSSFVL